jgi:hypothetical protein
MGQRKPDRIFCPILSICVEISVCLQVVVPPTGRPIWGTLIRRIGFYLLMVASGTLIVY